MPHSLSRILIQPRHCSSDWLIAQARDLAEASRRYAASNLLIYGALEARNAIEQLYFEILLLLYDGQVPRHLFQDWRRRGNGFRNEIKRVEPHYRQLARFTQIALHLDSQSPFTAVAWDFATLTRLWHALSDYCHAQGHPVPTLDSTDWMSRGYGLVVETYEYFRQNMTGGVTALLKPSDMSPEARAVWERYRDNRITESQMREELMQVSKSRTY